jgi:hypothetical protein
MRTSLCTSFFVRCSAIKSSSDLFSAASAAMLLAVPGRGN